MPILEPRHDLGHPVEGDSAWSESYYFNAYDPPTDTGIFTRIGIRPNEQSIDVGFSAWLPGDELAEYRFVRDQPEMIDTDLGVGGVRYEMLEPMRRWRLAIDAETSVRSLREPRHAPRSARLRGELEFTALMPAIGADGQGRSGAGAAAETRQSVGKGHLEQAGRWSGGLELDGRRFDWNDARGNRDKSWGPRRWGGPRMWRWFSINVGDDIHFGGIRIGTDAGDLHRGWVWRDGAHASIREWQVKTELADDGLTHRVSHVTAVDKNGGSHELRGDVLRVAPAPRMGTALLEGLARWEYDGRTGWGISEYLHQLDDAGRPVVPIE